MLRGLQVHPPWWWVGVTCTNRDKVGGVLFGMYDQVYSCIPGHTDRVSHVTAYLSGMKVAPHVLKVSSNQVLNNKQQGSATSSISESGQCS
jgi:hypothetical protein